MRRVTRQPPRQVRIAAPRFPAGMREALRWDRGVRTYDDLERLYVERGSPSDSIDPERSNAGIRFRGR